MDNVISLSKCCFFILLFSPLYVSCQSPRFRNISVDEGLLSSHTYSSVEDENGYLWVVTDKGICKFDGKDFTYLTAASGLTENSYFFSARNPLNKELWFISNNFKVFHGKGNTFHQLDFKQEIAWLDFDAEGRLWVLTRTGDIYYENNGTLTRYTSTAPEKAHHISIAGTLKNHTIIATTSEWVYHFSNRRKTVFAKPVKEFEFGARARIFKRTDGTFFLSFHDGLYLLGKDQKLKKLVEIATEIITVYEDQISKDVWIGTLKGIWKYDNGNFTGSDAHHYLKDIAILHLYKTSEGILAIETQHNGLFFLFPDAIHYNQQDGLLNNNILYMRKIRGQAFCIPANGDISVICKRTCKPYRFNNRSTQAGLIHYVAQATDSIIIERAHYRYCLRDDAFYALNELPYWFYVNTYYKDSVHLFQVLYLHNMYDVSNRIVQDERCYQTFQHLVKDKKRQLRGEYLLYDPSKQLFYYTADNGFIATPCKNEKSRVVHYDMGSDVSSLVQLNDSLLLAATYNKGLAIVKRGKTRFLSVREGLLSDLCLKLYYDGKYVWLITSKGLTRIVVNSDGTITSLANFTGNDALISAEVNDVTVIADTIYVGTNKGVSVFNRNIKLPGNRQKPFIELVKINNKDTALAEEYRLSYDENNIRIDYKQVSLRGGNSILYKYRLSVNEQDTVFTFTHLTSVQFHSLSPGNYVFSLWAKNIDGEWNPAPVQIRFVISRPFWKKPIFFIGIAMLLLAAITFTVLYRLNKRNKENSIKMLLKESELKALRLHMNPHFVFNTLNSLQSFVLNNKPLEANSYIVKFSRMIRWMMSYSDKNKIALREELELMEAYVELEQLRFETPFTLEVTMSPDINPDITFIPALVIQPFVENAIKHGLTGSNRHALLQLMFEKRDAYIVVTVQDNGAGRVKVKQGQARSMQQHQSTGISYTEERLTRLINDKSITKTITITDLYEADEAVGTRVELLIPILYE